MALQDYARLAVFFNGNALTQVTSIDLTTDSGQNPVNLLNEGLAGFTPGAGMCTVSIGFAVPIGGTEDTFQESCVDGAYATIQIPVGKVSYIGRGKLMNVKISQSVNGATDGTFEWHGELKPLS